MARHGNHLKNCRNTCTFWKKHRSATIAFSVDAMLPAFPEIADPLKSDGKLGTWWNAVSSDAVLKPMIDEYQAAVDDFVKMLRARAAG